MELRYKMNKDGTLIGNGLKSLGVSYQGIRGREEIHLGGDISKGEVSGVVIPDEAILPEKLAETIQQFKDLAANESRYVEFIETPPKKIHVVVSPKPSAPIPFTVHVESAAEDRAGLKAEEKAEKRVKELKKHH